MLGGEPSSHNPDPHEVKGQRSLQLPLA
uniref:Uncharacterized protein n=1 Tax=Anguilla anguilla TaxID=7936 RepID=A0A0E9SFP0_ANGAN